MDKFFLLDYALVIFFRGLGVYLLKYVFKETARLVPSFFIEMASFEKNLDV